jgi:hypothetical protein
MTTTTWSEANQRYLMARLSMIRYALDRHTGKPSTDPQPEIDAARQGLPAPAVLDTVCDIFGLSTFERDVLLLCAGVDLDASIPAACAAAHGDPRATYPTFGLALASLPDPHWSAIAPSAPLRFWRLLEVSPGESLTRSALRLDERILHYLAGLSYLDVRLETLIEPVATSFDLAPSHTSCAERISKVCSAGNDSSWPVVQLTGDARGEKTAIAAVASASLDLRLYSINAADIPATPERESISRLWDRECVLGRCALLVEWEEPEHKRAACAFADSIHGMTLVAGREPLRLRKRQTLHIEVEHPTAAEHRKLWQDVLGSAVSHLNGSLDQIAAQFRLGVDGIRAAGVAAGIHLREPGLVASAALWKACRAQARTRLEGLAQRPATVADWNDLVLPEAQVHTLREIAAQVRHRAKVYETWGFASRGGRGLGISALFSGSSGTGKTMAAEVIARDLDLDLFRIDLSQVVSKYIGETEKNLQRVFDAAEESGAVLLFDEADALFGKRSEVKDSHDRYANIEVSYLLQRMESYRGLAILTTNMKGLLDPAFLRRIRFVIQFPFPEIAHRIEIWRRVFPPDTPTERLDIDKLASLNVAGGNIRNIAVQAAFLAASAGEPVRMTHLLRAARSECAKLERPFTEAESRGWV